MESPDRIKESADLDRLGVSLVRAETLKRFGPFAGDPEPVRRLARLLASSSTCPMLVAEPGVGKTTLVRWLGALAWQARSQSGELGHDGPDQQLLFEGARSTQTPPPDPDLAHVLRSHTYQDIIEVTALDIARDCFYTFNLENKLDLIIKACQDKRAMLFLDDVHLCATSGASGADPSSTVAALLSSQLGGGKLRAIGATTPAGWAQLQRTSPQFARAFTPMTMDEASRSSTRDLLRSSLGLAPAVSNTQPVDFLDDLLDLVDTWLPSRLLPGKAVEVLREVASGARVERDDSSSPAWRDLLIETMSARTGLRRVYLDRNATLDRAALARTLRQFVFGQDEAVDAVVEHVARFKARLQDSVRPAAALLFVGPSGVGKTELARQLAFLLYGSADRLLRLDMSEFRTSDSLERIIGTTSLQLRQPALVERVGALSSAVVLLDEIEKAHPIILNLFLQVLSDGARLTTADGQSASFRNCFVVMTSNVGSNLYGQPAIGFDSRQARSESATRVMHKRLEDAFSPEFLNRTTVVGFRPLTRDSVRRIAHAEIDKLEQRLGRHHASVSLTADDAVIERLLADGYDPHLGARPMQRAAERLVGTVLADIVNAGALQTGTLIRLRMNGAQVEAIIEAPNPGQDHCVEMESV